MEGLEEIISALENIEIQNLSENEEIQDWLNKITDPEFQLIESFIGLLQEKIDDVAISTNIVKALRKFLHYKREAVSPQFRGNKDFLCALADYLINTNKDDRCIEGFILFKETYIDELFELIITEPLVKLFFTSLSEIGEESILNEIIRLLVNFNYSYCENKADLSSNLVIIQYLEHDNSNLFMEILLKLINVDNSKEELVLFLSTYINIMKASKTCGFYANDLEIFINFAIKKLESTYTTEIKFYLLTCLEMITGFPEYHKNKYKSSYLEELIDNYLYSNNTEDELKTICKVIQENLENH